MKGLLNSHQVLTGRGQRRHIGCSEADLHSKSPETLAMTRSMVSVYLVKKLYRKLPQ
jgi:hypothetical protein